MIKSNIKYSYNDISIIPNELSHISHRSECCPFLDNGKLPIFTAPMSTVVNINNFELFEMNNINAILPRSVYVDDRLEFAKNGKWTAFSLTEFERIFADEDNSIEFKSGPVKHILIDVANGHMAKIYELVKRCKTILGDQIEIMIGNIANPKTYRDAALAGASYVRLGIGSGSGCITSSNTGIHFPMASLIDETVDVRNNLMENDEVQEYLKLKHFQMPKIIADGGIRNYSDVIKALALGADYVMIGGLFASIIESAAPIHLKTDTGLVPCRDDRKIVDLHGKLYFEEKNKCVTEVPCPLVKVFYGMASSRGQIDLTGKKNKTSEGIEKVISVTTNLYKWSENMASYIQSAMSYLGIYDVYKLRNAEKCVISNNTYASINK